MTMPKELTEETKQLIDKYYEINKRELKYRFDKLPYFSWFIDRYVARAGGPEFQIDGLFIELVLNKENPAKTIGMIKRSIFAAAMLCIKENPELLEFLVPIDPKVDYDRGQELERLDFEMRKGVQY